MPVSSIHTKHSVHNLIMPYIIFLVILAIAVLGMEPALSIMITSTYLACNNATSATISLFSQTIAYITFIQFIWNPRKRKPARITNSTHSKTNPAETESTASTSSLS
jgi:hypothetical protein